MKEKDLKIGEKYLLKVNSTKRTWKWVDKAELVEIEGDVLTFVNRDIDKPLVYKVNKEEFLSGERVKPLNGYWRKKWEDIGRKNYSN